MIAPQIIGKGKFLLLFFLFTYSLFAYSQVDEEYDFYNDEIILYTIGEGHFVDNRQIHNSIIKYLLNETEVDYIIYETPIEIGVLLDSYLDEEEFISYGEFVKKLRPFLNIKVLRNIYSQVFLIKKYNQTHNTNIRIKGIDLISYDSFRKYRRYVANFFSEVKEVNSPFFNSTLLNPKFRLTRYKTRAYRKQALEEINQDIETYKKILKERFLDFYRAIDEISLSSELTYEGYEVYRENFMRKELLKVTSLDSKSILICGGSHAIKKENDTSIYGYPYTSIVASMEKKYPNQTYSIIQHYYEGRRLRLFSIFNLLNVPLREYLKVSKKKTSLIYNEDEKWINDDMRSYFDLLIISDTRWRIFR